MLLKYYTYNFKTIKNRPNQNHSLICLEIWNFYNFEIKEISVVNLYIYRVCLVEMYLGCTVTGFSL